MTVSFDADEPVASGPPATPAQEQHARRLARRTGGTFSPLRSVGHASKEIRRLQELERLLKSDERRQDDEISVAMQEEFGGATAFRDDEMDGHGSGAHWT